MGVVRVLLPALRPLARISPGAGGPLLGSALLRCRTPRWALPRPSPAHGLAWSEEAVGIYRGLVESGRPQHRPALARALALYGRSLLTARRYEESLAAVDESLAILDHRASGTLTAFALHVRAMCLADTNRLGEALATAQEAVERYRHTTPTRWERRLWRLPTALRTYGWLLGSLGRGEECVTVYRDCADLLRQMPLRQRIHHQDVYVLVLVELTVVLGALDRFGEAIEISAEARVQIDYFTRSSPEIAHLRALLLTHLAWFHGAIGNTSRARKAAEEAVAQCHRVAASGPAAGEPQLILADCLAHYLGKHGAPAGAPLDLRERVDFCTMLAADHPDVYEPALASALGDLASHQWRKGASEEAVATTEQSVEAYRRAARNDPQAHEPELARVLADLSVRQLHTGSTDEAVANGREALLITRRLSEAGRGTYQALVARRLRILARALRRAGCEDEALACYQEAVTILRTLRENADSEKH